MKTQVKKIIENLGLILLASVIIHGCSGVSDPYADSEILAAGGIGGANVTIGGGNISKICVEETSAELTYSPWKKYGGDISYEVTMDEVIITLIPRDGWGITETHLLVTTDEGELSTVPGQFPYGDEFDSAQSDIIEYVIPVSELGVSVGSDIDELFIYAHAVTGPLSGNSYYGYGGGGGSKWGKKGGNKSSKWGKKSKKSKSNNKSNKWGKSNKKSKNGGMWGKDYGSHKKDGKKGYSYKGDNDREKKYCSKNKTESVWAKLHITSFEDCGSGVGGVD